jgi:hypothetical protein
MAFDRKAWKEKALNRGHKATEIPKEQLQESPPEPFIQTISDEQWKLIVPYLVCALSRRFGFIDEREYSTLSSGQVPEVISLVIDQIGCPPVSEDRIPEVISILANLVLDLIMKSDLGRKGPFKTYEHLLLISKIAEALPEAERIFKAMKSLKSHLGHRMGFTHRSEPADLEIAALDEYDKDPGGFKIITRSMLKKISYKFSGGKERRDFMVRIFEQIMYEKSKKEAIGKAFKEITK